MTVLRLGLAAALCIAATAAGAQPISTYNDIAEIRNATPDCNANPQYPWIGRVSGNTQGPLDNTIPVSFVGCFPDERSCNLWKGRASAIITSTIIQYSCKRR